MPENNSKFLIESIASEVLDRKVKELKVNTGTEFERVVSKFEVMKIKLEIDLISSGNTSDLTNKEVVDKIIIFLLNDYNSI